MNESLNGAASRFEASDAYFDAEIADRTQQEIPCYNSADDKSAAGGDLEPSISVVVVFFHFYSAALVSDAHVLHSLLS